MGYGDHMGFSLLVLQSDLRASWFPGLQKNNNWIVQFLSLAKKLYLIWLIVIEFYLQSPQWQYNNININININKQTQICTCLWLDPVIINKLTEGYCSFFK